VFPGEAVSRRKKFGRNFGGKRQIIWVGSQALSMRKLLQNGGGRRPNKTFGEGLKMRIAGFWKAVRRHRACG